MEMAHQFGQVGPKARNKGAYSGGLQVTVNPGQARIVTHLAPDTVGHRIGQVGRSLLQPSLDHLKIDSKKKEGSMIKEFTYDAKCDHL